MTGPQRAAYVRGFLAWPKGDPVFARGFPWGVDGRQPAGWENRQNIAEDAYAHASMGFPAVSECLDTVTRIEDRRRASESVRTV